MRAEEFLKARYKMEEELAKELAKRLEGKDEKEWDYHCISWLVKIYGKEKAMEYIHPRCVGVIRRIVKELFGGQGATKEDKEDLAMEIEMEFYRCIEKYRGEGSLGGFIWAIAKRKKGRWKNSGLVLLSSVEDLVRQEEDDLWEEKEELRQAIKYLPEELRLLVDLRLQGYLWREIANILGCSVPTVRRHFCEAVGRLRKFFGIKSKKNDQKCEKNDTYIL
ncbi:sigma-70 family RNA polymerase sigma factor [bacterium]|nr:sigma-70 family RNA polymerase sigma factor [bacterium]